MNMIQQQDNLAIDTDKLRSDFLDVLRSRRPLLPADVPLTVQPGKHVLEPLYQEIPTPTYREAIESTPKSNIVNIPDFRELLREENLYLITEVGEQGRVPVLILRMKETNDKKRPAIVILHGTKMNKESLRPMLEAFASRGYITIAIDARYHGERGASNPTAYSCALISAWIKGDTMPFIYDTVWDLVKLADYLSERDDIDQSRIGITGVSLGGMEAWFAAFADTRYSVVAPLIGVQGFRWAIDHEQWHARVDSLEPLFEARICLGKSAVDKEVVEKVWERIAPGLASQFDAPFTIPTTAPRPLLVVNGELDPRCPVAGLEDPMSRARKAYEEAHSPDDVKLVIQQGIGHEPTGDMVKEASDWFDNYFKL